MYATASPTGIARMSPKITTMIRMDHTHVLATFHKYRITTAPSKKEALVKLITEALSVHAQLEEEIFYPAMRAAAPDVVEKSYPEHNEMKRLIAQLRDMAPGTPSYDETLLALMRDVIHHVADEETLLLPQAERVMPERLGELGWQMTRRRFELVGPRAGELAVNMARSFPGVFIGAAAFLGIAALMATRRIRRSSNGSDWMRAVERPARRLLGQVRG